MLNRKGVILTYQFLNTSLIYSLIKFFQYDTL